MNKDEAFKLLELYLGEFEKHPLFIKELQDLLKKELKGKEKQFFPMLITQLNNLRSFGIAIAQVDGHERLKGDGCDFYSIHIQRKEFNVRLLVYIAGNGEPYLLSAFYERGGKKKTDYSEKIKVLKSRLADMIGEER